MNFIWFFIVIIGLAVMLFSSPDAILPALLSGTQKGIDIAFSLLAVYVLWSGIVEILKKSGLSTRLSRLLSPITRKLFPNESDKTREYVALNFSANLLGAGGAATPLGIKAVESMQRRGDKITFSMVLFTVINTTSIQLIPSTVIALRANSGSTTPYDIILPTLIVSVTTTLLGVFITYLFKKKFP